MKEWFGKYILGLPPLASENGQDVDNLVIYVHWLMIALFHRLDHLFLLHRQPLPANHGTRRRITSACAATRRAWAVELANRRHRSVSAHRHRRAVVGEGRG